MCGVGFCCCDNDDRGGDLMLPPNCQALLIEAAMTKDLDRIQNAIDLVKLLSPESFLQNEQDMNARVFYGRPEGKHWTGTFRVIKIN
jgi:hypothetical protein